MTPHGGAQKCRNGRCGQKASARSSTFRAAMGIRTLARADRRLGAPKLRTGTRRVDPPTFRPAAARVPETASRPTPAVSSTIEDAPRHGARFAPGPTTRGQESRVRPPPPSATPDILDALAERPLVPASRPELELQDAMSGVKFFWRARPVSKHLVQGPSSHLTAPPIHSRDIRRRDASSRRSVARMTANTRGA